HADTLEAPRARDLAVERQRVDVELAVSRTRRHELGRGRRRVLAVPTGVGELLGLAEARGAGREADRRAKEHAVVVGVDAAIAVRVAEELDEVEVATVPREGGLP